MLFVELFTGLSSEMEVFSLEDDGSGVFSSQDNSRNESLMEISGELCNKDDGETSVTTNATCYSDISDDDDFVFPLSQKYGIEPER